MLVKTFFIGSNQGEKISWRVGWPATLGYVAANGIILAVYIMIDGYIRDHVGGKIGWTDIQFISVKSSRVHNII